MDIYIYLKKIDFLSNNDIKLQLVYNCYIIETECINNKNNSLINKDFIFYYVKGIPLIIFFVKIDVFFFLKILNCIKTMNILVTGGLGFIGHNFIKYMFDHF